MSGRHRKLELGISIRGWCRSNRSNFQLYIYNLCLLRGNAPNHYTWVTSLEAWLVEQKSENCLWPPPKSIVLLQRPASSKALFEHATTRSGTLVKHILVVLDCAHVGNIIQGGTRAPGIIAATRSMHQKKSLQGSHVKKRRHGRGDRHSSNACFCSSSSSSSRSSSSRRRRVVVVV